MGIFSWFKKTKQEIVINGLGENILPNKSANDENLHHLRNEINVLRNEATYHQSRIQLLNDLLRDERKKYRELVELTLINLRCVHCGGDLGKAKVNGQIDISLCQKCLENYRSMAYTEGRYFLKEELLELSDQENVSRIRDT